MATFSIIIATYNVEDVLSRCLDSIVPQLKDGRELIIVDGLSSDNTSKIITQYDQYLAYSISETDTGLYDAWNKGILHAKGDWILFLGADDRLAPDALDFYEELIEGSSLCDYDYICSQAKYVDADDKFIHILGSEPSWNKYRKSMDAVHVGSLHNRNKLFGQVGCFDTSYKICADYELLLRKRDQLKWFYSPHVTAIVQAGGKSVSSAALKEKFRARQTNHSVSFFQNCIIGVKEHVILRLSRIRMRILHFHTT